VKPLVLRPGVASTVFEVALIVWLAGEIWAMRRSRGGAAAGSDPTYYLMATAMTGGIVGALALARNLPSASISGGRTWPVVAGFVILAAGIALRGWSIATLGRFFTYAVRVQEGQRVVEDGPYRLLRHPSYTGLLMAFVGTGLALDNWLALACIVLLPLAAVLVRIRAEEATLGRELGEAYRAYSARTRRLVPGVW
jgi:protein-S-isoprenylcysteine O-methyltransferase Ste14